MDLTEALYVTRPTLAGETVIVVCTLAALRVEDTEGRKVYEPAGAHDGSLHGTFGRDGIEAGEERRRRGPPVVVQRAATLAARGHHG